ncbi:MAG: HAD family hydrolase [Ruminiclostridium sp.]|nr:HAD family hydrolase [Ruminiclostridium sp.]
MYRYVFFDLDGTVLNTIDDLAAAGNYALSEQGLPVYDTERYKYFVGNGIPKLIERILPPDRVGELYEKTHKLFSEYYSQHSEDMTRPYEGIPELLGSLRELGVKTAVITNKDNEFAQVLIRKYFGDMVTAVYGSIPGTPHKPDPYWVNAALADFGAEKDNVLYVGDSGVDMQTARNAGIASVGVLWGFRNEDELRENGAVHICREPRQILDIVKNS